MSVKREWCRQDESQAEEQSVQREEAQMDAREICSALNFEREEHGEGHEDTEYISSISDRKEKDMSKIQYGLRDIFSEPMFTNNTEMAPTLRHRHNRYCK